MIKPKSFHWYKQLWFMVLSLILYRGTTLMFVLLIWNNFEMKKMSFCIFAFIKKIKTHHGPVTSSRLSPFSFSLATEPIWNQIWRDVSLWSWGPQFYFIPKCSSLSWLRVPLIQLFQCSWVRFLPSSSYFSTFQVPFFTGSSTKAHDAHFPPRCAPPFILLLKK